MTGYADPHRRASYDELSPETRAVHAGQYPEEHAGALSVPVHMSSTFERAVVLDGGWDYSRIANPTRAALEHCLAALEGGSGATATASGMAAITTTVLATCHAGSHVVVPDSIYGGTWDLFSSVLSRWGVRTAVVDMSDLGAVAAAIMPDTSLVWVETPSNPRLRITDVAAVADLAHEAGAVLAVDSTFASPYLQQPLALGADLVIHSTTKYLGGHSDVTGGVIVSGSEAMAELIDRTSGVIGGVAGPMDAWLVLRGTKSLPVRMRHVSAAAMRIAEMLTAHPAVARVHYPGLHSHPQHDLAKRQMTDFGGVVSFEVRGSREDAAAVCARTRLFTLAVSLGSVESLIQHPANMTHCTTGGTQAAVPETLVRLSIGLEDVDDLVADLDAALDQGATLAG
ncbi:PLP-dependent aspartate aminotransferase family protein [Pseudonocardia sp. MH-G8]|uniref:trans-sulfuration enzyme family protein n=1 Tax=Pseudonocardia sp. MH-G8 TaxID=1854588 RepID=UPI000BA0774C|nr:PLP-dependent transferase [Pseudonocardia sp. MH-G8]OZM81725.1 cystathionine gamma-synthase [Pseudonocardia sp. MH-G8]